MSDAGSVLRTPDERFHGLEGYPFPARYIDLGGARMHYVEQGRGQILLCLHGAATWSYLYRKVIPELAWKHRVIAPDLVGFGRSDKYEDGSGYSLRRHAEQIGELVRRLGLNEITLVCHDWGAAVALALLRDDSARFFRLVFLNPRLSRDDAAGIGERDDREILAALPAEARAAYEAPFPERRYEAGLRSFRRAVSSAALECAAVLSDWFKPALVLVSDQPPGPPLTPSSGPPVVVSGGGFLLPELRGEEVADRIHSFILRNPPSTPTKTFQPVPFW